MSMKVFLSGTSFPLMHLKSFGSKNESLKTRRAEMINLCVNLRVDSVVIVPPEFTERDTFHVGKYCLIVFVGGNET